jgi:hypothetical protein
MLWSIGNDFMAQQPKIARRATPRLRPQIRSRSLGIDLQPLLPELLGRVVALNPEKHSQVEKAKLLGVIFARQNLVIRDCTMFVSLFLWRCVASSKA